MREFTSTLQETKKYYVELIALPRYTTNSSRKAILTRARKEQEVWHDDLVRAYNRSHRMLHGESVSLADCRHAWAELKIINELYATL